MSGPVPDTGRLDRLLRPRSIAVIGGGWGRAVIAQCRKMGFDGAIWPVHPALTTIDGLPAFARIEDLPAPPDAAFVAINRHASIEAVAALARAGAGGAVCFASGFAETAGDGPGLQSQLVAAAGAMPILGPNCYGLINYLDGALLWPDEHGGQRTRRGVAIIGQSSNVLINLTMQRRALPLGYVMAAGNQAQTGLADMAEAALADPRVTAIGLHIEGIGDLRAFEAMAARARDRRVPIVALKSGRSAGARAAALSHTASITGGDAVARAFLTRLGIGLAETLPAFLETLKLLHVHGPLPGRTIGAMSCSGGEAGLVADAAAGQRVDLPALGARDAARLGEVLGPLVSIANPLDYHTFIWGDEAAMTRTYATMLGAGFDLSCLVYDMPRPDRASDAGWVTGLAAIEAAARGTGARTAVVASLPETLPEAVAERLMAAGIAPLAGIEEAVAAAATAADIAAAWAAAPPPPVLAPRPVGPARLVDEAAAKALLSAAGVPVPRGEPAPTPEAAAAVAARLTPPLALKGLGHAHKSEAGAVRLGLDPAGIADAARAMPGASGFLVEEMVGDPIAELLVGVIRDPVCGLTLTVGAGGVLAEMLADRAVLCIPASRGDIADALSGLRIAPLLTGYRGKPGADMDRLLDSIEALQGFAVANASRLEDVEINPLIVTPTRAVAADALLHLTDPPGPAEPIPPNPETA